jgi:hypothetical protein
MKKIPTILLFFSLFIACSRGNDPTVPPVVNIHGDSLKINAACSVCSGSQLDSFSIGGKMYYPTIHVPIEENDNQDFWIEGHRTTSVIIYVWVRSPNCTMIINSPSDGWQMTTHFQTNSERHDSAVFQNVPLDSLSNITFHGDY